MLGVNGEELEVETFAADAGMMVVFFATACTDAASGVSFTITAGGGREGDSVGGVEDTFGAELTVAGIGGTGGVLVGVGVGSCKSLRGEMNTTVAGRATIVEVECVGVFQAGFVVEIDGFEEVSAGLEGRSGVGVERGDSLGIFFSFFSRVSRSFGELFELRSFVGDNMRSLSRSWCDSLCLSSFSFGSFSLVSFSFVSFCC